MYRQGRRSWGAPPNILLKGPCINRAPPVIRLQHVLPCQSAMKTMKCLYCLNCLKLGQLIIRKIIRIVATRCQILGVKMYKIWLRLGLRPKPHLRSLQCSPWLSWLHLRGYISKGKGREEEGRVNEGEKVGRKKEFAPPNLHHRSTPLCTGRPTESKFW